MTMRKLLSLLLALLLVCPAALCERLTDEELVSFYDGAIFIGDSLPRMLRNYIVPLREKDPSFFKDVRFYTAYSYQMRTATLEYTPSSKANLVYMGSDTPMCQIMAYLKPPRMFFLAGLNDKIGQYIDRGMEYVEKIMALMEKYSPETEVYFFSLTPVTAKVEAKRHIQDRWDEYNARLAEKCPEVGAHFIDIATNLKGEDGLMKKGISHDGEYHLNDKGNAIWVQTLLDYAQEQYDAGLWFPYGSLVPLEDE